MAFLKNSVLCYNGRDVSFTELNESKTQNQRFNLTSDLY